jgi:hypothetical protein
MKDDKVFTTPEYTIERVRPRHHTGAEHFPTGKGWSRAEDEATSDLPLPKDADKATQRLRKIGPFLCALKAPYAHWSIVELQDTTGRFNAIPESLQGSWVQLSDLEKAITELVNAKGETNGQDA